MKHTVETQFVPYSTIVMHCLKYPAKGVVGLLVGKRIENNKIVITACVPLCHESTPLAPSLEIATSLVHAKFGDSLVGVYFSNGSITDKTVNPYATRLAERISSVTSSTSVIIQVMNDRLIADCEEDRLVAYEKDGDTWKETKHLFKGSNILRGLQNVGAAKMYRELNDFENHLDNPELDFYNTVMTSKLLTTAELGQ